MKSWICTTLTNFYGTMQGPARLYAYLREKGHDVVLKDFNQNVFFTLLSKEYIGGALERLAGMLDPMSRNKALRENVGSILLHSSNHALKQLLAGSILAGNRWYDSLRHINPIRNAVDRIAGLKVNAGNIYYALLSIWRGNLLSGCESTFS